MALFRPSAKPKQTSKATVAAFESAMPDAAFAKARNEYYESVGQPAIDRARLFVICLVLLGILVLMAIAFFRMIPLKSNVPYVVAVDAINGKVVPQSAGEVKRAAEYTPDRPVLERELFEFAQRLYAINADYPKMVQDGHIAAYAYTRGKATAEFKSFLDAEQPYQRQKATKGLARTVIKKTISFREDGQLVLIRYRTSERSDERPVPVLRDWLMTVQFVREQPTATEELDVNPLGIYITNFEVVEER